MSYSAVPSTASDLAPSQDSAFVARKILQLMRQDALQIDDILSDKVQKAQLAGALAVDLEVVDAALSQLYRLGFLPFLPISSPPLAADAGPAPTGQHLFFFEDQASQALDGTADLTHALTLADAVLRELLASPCAILACQEKKLEGAYAALCAASGEKEPFLTAKQHFDRILAQASRDPLIGAVYQNLAQAVSPFIRALLVKYDHRAYAYLIDNYYSITQQLQYLAVSDDPPFPALNLAEFSPYSGFFKTVFLQDGVFDALSNATPPVKSAL
jgi:DNA-binding FadR family transcriptional regulator